MQPKLGDFIFKFFYIFSDLQSQIYSFIYRHAPDFSDPVCFFFFSFSTVGPERWGGEVIMVHAKTKWNDNREETEVSGYNCFVQQYISTLATCGLF